MVDGKDIVLLAGQLAENPLIHDISRERTSFCWQAPPQLTKLPATVSMLESLIWDAVNKNL